MAFYGIDIPPHWRVLPPSVAPESRGPLNRMALLRIQSGRAFGVGTHETTQLCLRELGELLHKGRRPSTMLDFGAGSGILGIAAAISGVRVEAVEIDALSQEDARTNANLNNVSHLIEFRSQLSEPPRTFDWVFANILNHVLLEFAEALAARVSKMGILVLSGLSAADLPGILERYQSLLPTMVPTVSERGSWRAIRFSPTALTAS